ncbi:MAG: glycosyltransferase family 4 protein [Microthrixaceae bacterium]
MAELYPWPAVDGYRQRLHHMLRGLVAAGHTDLFCLADTRREPAPPQVEGLGRVVTAARVERSARQWARDWLAGSDPRRMLAIDWREAHRELGAWAPEVDLVWYSHIDSWAAVSDLYPDTPAIVDFDNLENLLLRLRRRTTPRIEPGDGLAGAGSQLGRWAASRAFDLVDERRWSTLQQRCAESVDRVAVCSPLDVERSGLDNAVAVPNGSSVVEDADADRAGLRGDVPTMTFVGALDYEPNADAVTWFASEVLPLVRRRLPTARLRVVGRGSGALGMDEPPPGLEIVGEVEDLGVELELTDVSVVPIRLGAGTRLKVVEAMARHLPLVTTSVGCEGIAIGDGVHALVADDARRFADACIRLLGDGELRGRLAAAAGELFEDRYRWSAVEEQVAALAREVASGEPHS